jgi:septum site-determining protein MinC
MNASRSQSRSEAFEITDTLAPVTALRLKTLDVARVEEELRARIATAPHKFLYAPVVVDVAELGASAAELALHDLADRLRACKLLPVGAANLPPSAVWNAAAAGMSVLPPADARPRPVELPRPEPPPSAEPPPVSTVTVRQPVRAGQVIYAKGGDLVVLAAVNSSAQLIADGHIHIYGPLRGRAHAGARGMTEARVFCDSLEAELVSIAGVYLVADKVPREQRGRRSQISLEKGQFRIETL